PVRVVPGREGEPGHRLLAALPLRGTAADDEREEDPLELLPYPGHGFGHGVRPVDPVGTVQRVQLGTQQLPAQRPQRRPAHRTRQTGQERLLVRRPGRRRRSFNWPGCAMRRTAPTASTSRCCPLPSARCSSTLSARAPKRWCTATAVAPAPSCTRRSAGRVRYGSPTGSPVPPTN